MHSLLYKGLLLIGILQWSGNCQTPTAPDHPDIPVASLPALPQELNDIPKGNLDCWNSYYKYSFTSYFLHTEFSKSATELTTTLSPPHTGSRTYSWDHEADCSTTTISLTTLCDGFIRASRRDINCRTVPTTRTETYTEYTSRTTIGPTWTSEIANPAPICTVANDLSPLCGRLIEAWEWHTANLRSESPGSPDLSTRMYNLLPPCTPLANTPAPTEKPLCRISASAYSAYHWPKPTPTGTQFCNSDWAPPPGTPTTPGKPNTVVISGHTLTSPSVYHFIKDVEVKTYVGYARNLGLWAWPPGYEIWNVSTSVPANRPVTVAQREEDIFTASEACSGREMDYCTMSFEPSFRINDMSTVRADQYKKYCSQGRHRPRCDLVIQASYTPTIAIPVSEIVRQNGGILSDCQWDLWESNDEENCIPYCYTSSSAAFATVKATATNFLPITTSREVSGEKDTRVTMLGPTIMTTAKPAISP